MANHQLVHQFLAAIIADPIDLPAVDDYEEMVEAEGILQEIIAGMAGFHGPHHQPIEPLNLAEWQWLINAANGVAPGVVPDEDEDEGIADVGEQPEDVVDMDQDEQEEEVQEVEEEELEEEEVEAVVVAVGEWVAVEGQDELVDQEFEDLIGLGDEGYGHEAFGF